MFSLVKHVISNEQEDNYQTTEWPCTKKYTNPHTIFVPQYADTEGQPYGHQKAGRSHLKLIDLAKYLVSIQNVILYWTCQSFPFIINTGL